MNNNNNSYDYSMYFLGYVLVIQIYEHLSFSDDTVVQLERLFPSRGQYHTVFGLLLYFFIVNSFYFILFCASIMCYMCLGH